MQRVQFFKKEKYILFVGLIFCCHLSYTYEKAGFLCSGISDEIINLSCVKYIRKDRRHEVRGMHRNMNYSVYSLLDRGTCILHPKVGVCRFYFTVRDLRTTDWAVLAAGTSSPPYSNGLKQRRFTPCSRACPQGLLWASDRHHCGFRHRTVGDRVSTAWNAAGLHVRRKGQRSKACASS